MAHLSSSLDPDGGGEARSLPDLLAYASGHYAHHTDWSLRHRDAGFTALAALLTAEFAVAAFAFSTPLPPLLAVVTLSTIAALAAPLTRLAVQSWTQAYTAALEHAALVAKVIWAMGFGHTVDNATECVSQGPRPLADDPTPLFVPRYIGDAIDRVSTKDFVEWNLKKKGTAFQATRWTLLVMGAAAVFFGIGSAVAVATFR